MRWLVAAALVLVPGCSAPPEAEVAYDGTVNVPSGLHGYLEFILSTGQNATWSWSADHPVVHRWQMRCNEGKGDGAAGEMATSGADGATGTSARCKVMLFWNPPTFDASVAVRVMGQGVGFTTGVEDGT
jgi:hypothetical protein